MQDKKNKPPVKSDKKPTTLDPAAIDPSGLWQDMAKDLKPLKPKPVKEVTPTPSLKRIPRREENQVVFPPLPQQSARHGLDRNSKNRLKKGEIPIEARLDLHGRTLAAAHKELTHFLKNSYVSGLRCVLVITGKGGRAQKKEVSLPPQDPSQGVLRQNLSLWLEHPDLSGIILGASPARPHHGGEGAVYILLRRDRSTS
jgi:DNA-nicking Smr family endonuclease